MKSPRTITVKAFKDIELAYRRLWQDVRDAIATSGAFEDHGALTGLTDDDHTQYLLASGSRALAGNWDLGGFNLNNGGMGVFVTITDGVASLSGGVGTGYTLTSPDINGGTVDGITSLTVANNVDIGNYTLTANGLTIDGAFTDGTVTITGGVITGLTIGGNFAWTGTSTLDASDNDKIITIPGAGGFEFKNGSLSWLSLITATNFMSFGNVTDNPDFQFNGTGTMSTGGGRQVKTTRITANTTLDDTHHNVFCDTDGGVFTATLPASPVSGQTYRIINTGSSSNDLTIARNGNLLTGGTDDRTLSDSSVIILTYESTEGWW